MGHPSAPSSEETSGGGASGRLQLDPERARACCVLVATPIHTSWVSAPYMASMLQTQSTLDAMGIGWNLLWRRGSNIDKQRNELVAEFLADDRYTHLCFIDADQGFDPKQIPRLLAYERPVIGVLVPKKSHEMRFAGSLLGAEMAVEDGAVEVADLGTGFVMMERSVFAEMAAAYPELQVQASEDVPPEKAKHLYAFYQTALGEDGQYRSEDLTFCDRWRAIGGRIFVDPMGRVDHLGEHTYTGGLLDVADPRPREEG